MKRWMILCIVNLFTSLFANEEDCFCGTVKHDPLYARAVYLLNLSVRNTLFHMDLNFPNVADEFYPSLELRTDYEDPYPFEGQISWHGIDKCLWDKDFLLGINEHGHSKTEIEIPTKFIRKREWTDCPNVDNQCEHQEKKVFEFQKNYAAIPQAFSVLRDDIVFFYDKSEIFLNARNQDLANGIEVFESDGSEERFVKKKTIAKRKQKVKSTCRDRLSFMDQKEAEAITACTKSLELCIARHHNPRAYLNRGLFYFIEGESVEALSQVQAALEKLKKEDFDKLKEDAIFLKGQAELDAGLYADAVLTLTELINQNPAKKEAYFERASAYFELGNFDLCLEDYLASELKPQTIINNSVELVSFSLGLTKGVLQGGAQAGMEYIPSMLSSLQGIGHGLWAFAQNPVQMSIAFVQASQACINFIKDHTPKETLSQLVPELIDLVKKWDELKDEKRGEITGHIIGKYGVEIFAGVGIGKCMTAYRNLKRANNLLTFEAIAFNDRNKIAIATEAANRVEIRKQILQSANIEIQWDKQGKHIQAHKNFQAAMNRSFLEHPDPQKLINNFAGKGMRVNSIHPGTSGYQEIVNFKENIGFSVHPDTGEKIATSWGKVHYAKDGVHIVPTKPR